MLIVDELTVHENRFKHRPLTIINEKERSLGDSMAGNILRQLFIFWKRKKINYHDPLQAIFIFFFFLFLFACCYCNSRGAMSFSYQFLEETRQLHRLIPHQFLGGFWSQFLRRIFINFFGNLSEPPNQSLSMTHSKSLYYARTSLVKFQDD